MISRIPNFTGTGAVLAPSEIEERAGRRALMAVGAADPHEALDRFRFGVELPRALS